jgi:hypothetical protein
MDIGGIDFSNLSVEPVDGLGRTNAGRSVTPIPDTVLTLVENSYNEGHYKNAYQIKLANDDQVKAFCTFLKRAGDNHEPPVTVRRVIEGTTVRFEAVAKIVRSEESKAAAAAKRAALKSAALKANAK